MSKVKVKMFPTEISGKILVKDARGETEKEINEFIANNDIEVIDIRLSSNQYGFLYVLLLYKEKN
jgi:hypothetical protein